MIIMTVATDTKVDRLTLSTDNFRRKNISTFKDVCLLSEKSFTHHSQFNNRT